MSEYDVFVQSIPMIAEIIVKCRKMDKKSYEEWKNEIIQTAEKDVKSFARKVLIVIDKYVAEAVI